MFAFMIYHTLFIKSHFYGLQNNSMSPSQSASHILVSAETIFATINISLNFSNKSYLFLGSKLCFKTFEFQKAHSLTCVPDHPTFKTLPAKSPDLFAEVEADHLLKEEVIFGTVHQDSSSKTWRTAPGIKLTQEDQGQLSQTQLQKFLTHYTKKA